MNESVHENEHYAVFVNPDDDGYEVVNSSYGVVEFKGTTLPECIYAAEHLNSVLTHRPYEKIASSSGEGPDDLGEYEKFAGPKTVN